jgi:Phage derived protein Gp49-like (DUF891)
MADWLWEFRGYQTLDERKPVQDWYNKIPDSHRAEIVSLILFLRKETTRPWARYEFDPLVGAGGISEIKVPNIRGTEGQITYRLYGFFGPGQHQYTLLHCNKKDRKNDRPGKRIAKQRFDEILRQQADTHVFDFEKRGMGGPKEGGSGAS